MKGNKLGKSVFSLVLDTHLFDNGLGCEAGWDRFQGIQGTVLRNPKKIYSHSHSLSHPKGQNVLCCPHRSGLQHGSAASSFFFLLWTELSNNKSRGTCIGYNSTKETLRYLQASSALLICVASGKVDLALLIQAPSFKKPAMLFLYPEAFWQCFMS